MLFEYIKYNNYRPYYGEQVIDFRNRDNRSDDIYKKNIVLIGGLNGHGKTSIINSILICLFGHRAFKNQTEYYEYLSKSVNIKHVQNGGRDGSIELAFSEDSEIYAIEVSFIHGQEEEFRKVYELNESFEKVREISFTSEEFIEFIDSRIPLDVAQFFIFDAEKIRDLVGDQDKEETRKAIQKVVSLEIYNQLLKDLDKLYDEFSKQIKGKISNTQLNDMYQRIENITSELESLENEVNFLETQYNELNTERITTEQERRKLIANAGQTKASLNKVIGQYETKLQKIEEDLTFLKKNQLYQIILQPAIKNLKIRLMEERQFLDSLQRIRMKFAPYEDFMTELLNIDINPKLTEEQKTQLKEHGKRIWAKINHIQHTIVSRQIEILHDLSPGEYQTLLTYPETKPMDLKKLIEEKQKAQEMLKKYYDQLNSAPDEVNTSEYDQKLNDLNQQLGEIKIQLREKKPKITQLRNDKIRLKNEYQRKLNEIEKIGPLKKKTDLLQKLYNATYEFVEKVTVLKARQMKTEIEKILKQLFRKSDFQQILFDHEKFTLTIINQFGNPIDLNSRSEGEKQLIALSMIWALTKVSGSRFPFVIDTPLARLDSVHRTNLVEHYFTKLNDQVIILTTDTEITKDFYQELIPFIETEYTLVYDHTENYSKIEKGYFFSREEAMWRA